MCGKKQIAHGISEVLFFPSLTLLSSTVHYQMDSMNVSPKNEVAARIFFNKKTFDIVNHARFYQRPHSTGPNVRIKDTEDAALLTFDWVCRVSSSLVDHASLEEFYMNKFQ